MNRYVDSMYFFTIQHTTRDVRKELRILSNFSAENSFVTVFPRCETHKSECFIIMSVLIKTTKQCAFELVHVTYIHESREVGVYYGHSCVRDICPVSYTHLDVYKRQHLSHYTQFVHKAHK